MNRFDYVKPDGLNEASATLSDLDGKGKIMAGGTGLIPSLNHGLLRPQVLVDLGGIAELNGIDETRWGDIRIAAGTRLCELSSLTPVRTKYPALGKAADSVASFQVRHRATVGGNVCLDTRCWYFNEPKFWRASYPDCRKTGGDTCYVVRGGDRCYALMSSDLVPLLVALDATVEIFNSGVARSVPVQELFTGDGANPLKLGPGDIVTHIVLPNMENTLLGYQKFYTHSPVNFGLVTLAVGIQFDSDYNLIERVRLVFGCIDSAPVRCPKTEASIAGIGANQLDPSEVGVAASKEISIFSSVNAGQAYKKQIAEYLATNTLTRLLCNRQTPEERQR